MNENDEHFKEAKEILNKENEEENDGDTLDKALHHLGDMGRYQKFLFICMMPIGFFFAFIYFVQMFIAATPQQHWCRVPELAHLDMELRRNLSAPGAAAGGLWDKCSMYDTNWTRVLETMTPPDPNTTTIPCQHGWDFDFVDIPYATIVSEIVAGKTKNSQYSILTVIRSAPLRFVILVMMFLHMCSAIVFDGLVRMSDNLGLDFFITFTIASVTEVISVSLLAVVLDRWGRRVLGSLPILITGIFMLVAMFTPKGIPQATFAILGRFFINMSYITAIQWTMELLPTGVRALGSNALHVAGSFATIFSPFIIYSERFWSGLPLLFLGVASLLAGGASILLPETRGRSMPQTIEDGERLFREYSVCGKPEKEDVEIPQWRTEKEKAFIT